jgi:hypothetical protein
VAPPLEKGRVGSGGALDGSVFGDDPAIIGADYSPAAAGIDLGVRGMNYRRDFQSDDGSPESDFRSPVSVIPPLRQCSPREQVS